jgi:2,4-dienoyl-CoA reductase-like NADH-dependent reductase (Old Yellow Enzyme family)
VHFIEPRFDRIAASGETFNSAWSLPEVSNAPFRSIISEAGIPCFSCGGWDGSNLTEAAAAGWDAVAIARWFTSNPDLPERLRLGKQLHAFDRSRFYGSWDGVREKGYTDFPTWQEDEDEANKKDEQAGSK